MTRPKTPTLFSLAIGIAVLLPLVGAQKPAADSSLASLTMALPKNEQAGEALGFRQVSGEFELAKPVESVALTVEVYDDGMKTTPFPRGWVLPRDERRGTFAVLFVDLENLPTVVNTNDLPLRLARPRSFYKGSLSMGKGKGLRGSGPIDTDRLINLGSPVQYHVFDRSAATDANAPLFAMYAGTAPLNANGVRSVDELLKRNPKGRLVVASLSFNDHPGADRRLHRD